MNKSVKFFTFFFINLLTFLTIKTQQKVLIITHVHSRPDFIELHDKTFKAFLKDDYEYVVFNDAPTDEMCKKMETKCKELGVQCIRIPQVLHSKRNDPSGRHIDGIQYSLERLGYNHNGPVLIIDSDMFLIKPFSVIEYLQCYDFIAGEQYHTNGCSEIAHASACLTFINMMALPNRHTLNFSDGYVEGIACDVGGQTYYYFKNNPTVRTKFFHPVSTDLLPRDEEQLRALGYDNNAINLIIILGKSLGMEFHADGNFLHHYAGGSNWPGFAQDYLKEKSRIINHYIDQVIQTYKQGI